MEKVYVVRFGTWEYEAASTFEKYFKTRKLALKYALSMRKDMTDAYYFELPFKECVKTREGNLLTQWEESYGGYEGTFIEVCDENVLDYVPTSETALI